MYAIRSYYAEALDRPVGEAEESQLLGRRCVYGETVGVVGVPLRPAHLLRLTVVPDRALAQEEDMSVVSVIVAGELDEINNLTGKLGNIPNVTVKTSISKKEF